ncbi:acyltransferase family protein [Sphingobium sp. H39-3-25]|uniref:acyltransferase family protein n=1 Tax=Sphingobium arseniciresistens TaxID=3030834 RepID=UPI0023B96A9D|nr:acyltransferase family protein [Sphingobium arseniciresistens]
MQNSSISDANGRRKVVATLSQKRHYGMDWLRIGAFGILILYHVGMAFVSWPFEIKVTAPIDWIAIPMMFTNPWRLSLLFAISGYASAAVLSRSTGYGPFLRGRFSRLGIPLLFGMAVVVTPQPWVALVTQHGYANGFLHFLAFDYYRFQFIDGIAMPTWMHLWFVLYLLVYTLALAALLRLPASLRATIRALVERPLAGRWLLPLPIAFVFVVREVLPPGWIDTHGLFDDWSAHATYLPLFLFGVLLRGSAGLQVAVGRQWRYALAVGIVAYPAIAILEAAFPGATPLPDMVRLAYHGLRAVMLWTFVVGLIGMADRYWNHDHCWRTTLAEAVFPFYIIHQTIILVVGYWLLPTPTGPLIRFVILIAATALGCWLFYAIGRRLTLLRPLIGLKRQSRRASDTGKMPNSVSAS